MSNLINKALHVAELSLQMIKSTSSNEKIPARVNIENRHKLAASGFTPGVKYDVSIKPDRIVFKISENGTNTVSPKVFRLRNGEVVGSRCDVRQAEVAEKFGCAGKLMVFYMKGYLVITASAIAINNNRRIERLRKAIAERKIETFSLYSGIGTLDSAIHDGFKLGGVNARLIGVNDSWGKAVSCLLADNPCSSASTKSYTMGLESLIAMGGGNIGDAVMINAGIVCKGASKLNVATRDLPELHDTAGHQVLNLVMALQAAKWQTPLIHAENVVAWTDTVSCSMLERVLVEQGYDVVYIGAQNEGGYAGLDLSEYGEIEKRVRMSLLAYPKGLGDFDMSFLDRFRTGNSTKTIADIRLPESRIDQSDYDKGKNLFSEKKRSKGWKVRVMSESANVTPSLSAGCWRQRVEDPRFKHPSDHRSRIPVPEEHCALKGHDDSIIESMPYATNAHTALGNGVARKPWIAVGYAIVSNIKRWIGCDISFVAA
ncbi:DNA cytosine methyltransferase [Photobacterium leiognathi]|uniref:hypothetical protein n=1 Tax=Photobacterium leiognathi TaxID=553611 RepID=UPI001EDFF67C|nr:hypothetical protein [Photobacterium leiognathi]MCG3883253.1 DNA cytosine methyltransferase [Photobacterium leiognathi]